jgi:hypothetical protein
MHGSRSLTLGAVALLVCDLATAQQPAEAERLTVTEQEGSYVLTVPVSRLVLTVSKGRLSQIKNSGGGSADSPRYFYFEDATHQLILSGWFESAQHYPGIKEFWAGETAAWDRHLPKPQNVSFEKLGSWDTILYDLPVPGGGSSNIRAHWLQAGTWIDLHISTTSDSPQKERRGKVRDLLDTIQISEKRP